MLMNIHKTTTLKTMQMYYVEHRLDLQDGPWNETQVGLFPTRLQLTGECDSDILNDVVRGMQPCSLSGPASPTDGGCQMRNCCLSRCPHLHYCSKCTPPLYPGLAQHMPYTISVRRCVTFSSDLLPHAQYLVRVKAYNQLGRGVPSDHISFETQLGGMQCP